MTNQEFSDEFDILYNNITSNQAPGLDPYEKSVFLTLALELIVKELYSGTTTSFESTEAVRRALDNLISTVKFYGTGSLLSNIDDDYLHFNYKLPSDCWYIIFEKVNIESNDCLDGKTLSVYPVTHDDYYRSTHNPFRGPNSRKVLRLDNGPLEVELVSSYNINSYTVRYLAKPSPIILEDLTNTGVSINNETSISACELSELLHREILVRAVLLASSVYKS